MHEFVSFNGQISSPQQISLHAVSSAAFYGKGVFTTVAVYNGKPFLWEKHWKRLVKNAERLLIDLSEFPEDTVKTAFTELIKRNETFNARARLTFFDESSGEIWRIKNNRKTSLLMTTAEFRPVSKKLSLTVSPYRVNSRSPLVNIKSCNYLENILAFREATENGFDEAIRLNEKGDIVSACLANIFWTKGDKIFTSDLKTGALQGTTREFILENFAVCETTAKLMELENAETIFITSAGIGIAEVGNLKQFYYTSTKSFRQIEKLFKKVAKTPRKSNGFLDF